MAKRLDWLAILTLAYGPSGALCAHAAERIDLISTAPGPPWRVQSFDTDVPATLFRSMIWDGVTAIESVARASMGLLVRPLDVDLSATPVLCWRWRIDAPLQRADLATRSGDDFAARIYLAFDVPAESMSIAERAKLRIARSMHGASVPSAAINYVWDNRYPVGTIRASAYTKRVRLVVLRSGARDVGAWVSERRDLLADVEALFGAKHPGRLSIAIGSDTDNTGEHARAGFADIHLRPRAAPCNYGPVEPTH